MTFFHEGWDKCLCNQDICHYKRLTSSDIVEMMLQILDQTTLFDGLEEGAMRLLEPLLEPFSCSQGTVLFEQGDPAVFLYIVISGSIVLRYKPYDAPPST